MLIVKPLNAEETVAQVTEAVKPYGVKIDKELKGFLTKQLTAAFAENSITYDYNAFQVLGLHLMQERGAEVAIPVMAALSAILEPEFDEKTKKKFQDDHKDDGNGAFDPADMGFSVGPQPPQKPKHLLPKTDPASQYLALFKAFDTGLRPNEIAKILGTALESDHAIIKAYALKITELLATKLPKSTLAALHRKANQNCHARLLRLNLQAFNKALAPQLGLDQGGPRAFLGL